MSTRLRLIFLTFGFGLFLILVYNFGIDNITSSLAQMSWWFIPIVLVWLVVYVLNTFAWRALIPDGPQRIGFHSLLRITISSCALNYSTPLLSIGGEPYRVIAIRDLIGTERSISSVIQYNIVKVLAHCCFWMVGVILVLCTQDLPPAAVMLLVLLFVVTGLPIALVVTRPGRRSLSSLRRTLLRFRFMQRLESRLEDHGISIDRISKQITGLAVTNRRVFVISLLTELISRIVASLEFVLIFSALGMNASMVNAILINAASSLIMNILFFIPFELGSREGSMLLIVQGMMLASGTGVFISLVTRLRELVWILVGLLLLAGRGWKQAHEPLGGLMDTGGKS
jgi:uncharacterized membrane protein YbhN (UPF0104 family)